MRRLPRPGGDTDRQRRRSISTARQPIDTTQWYRRSAQGVRARRSLSPRTGLVWTPHQFLEKLFLGVGAQIYWLLTTEVDILITNNQPKQMPTKRRHIVGEIEKDMAEDGGRPISSTLAGPAHNGGQRNRSRSEQPYKKGGYRRCLARPLVSPDGSNG